MIIDLSKYSPNNTYHLITQLVVPRPIAWILTGNADGKSYNLAPFSYFNAVASDPPLLMVSFAPKPGGELKDTVKNCLRDEQFVIHLPNHEQSQAVQQTSTPLPYGESELSESKLALSSFAGSKLPRLSDCPVAFSCRLYHKQTLGNAPQTLIFGEIKHAYIDDKAVSVDGKRITVSSEQLSPLARLGKEKFAGLRKPITL